MQLGLREKFLLPIVFIVAMGVIVSVLLTYRQAAAAIEYEVGGGLEREVRQTVKQIDIWINARKTDLSTWNMDKVYRDALVETGYYGKSAREGAAATLAMLQRGYTYYEGIFVADREGNVIASANPLEHENINLADRDYFRGALEGHTTVSGILISRETNKDIFVVAAPIYDGNAIVGVIGGVVRLASFSAQFVDDFQLKEGYAFLVDTDGRVIAQSADSSIAVLDPSDFAVSKELMTDRFLTRRCAHEGEQRIASVGLSTESGWLFAETQSLDEALATTRHAGRAGALVGLVAVIIVSITIALFFRHVILRRLAEMLCVIGRVESGDLEARVTGPVSDDEVGVLTRAFNTMTGRLQATLDALNGEIAVRRKAEEELSAHRAHLEEVVAGRTFDLTRSNAQLMQSIATRDRAEAELHLAKDAAEAANRSKSEFLANMSHEIRTPMTAILGFADMLLDEEDGRSISPQQYEAAQTIRRNGQHLISLINDILDISKVEAGRMTVELIDCSLVEIIAEVEELMRVRAAAKALPFHVTIDGPIPETIHSDPTRLRQILINLLGNAIKFTECGCVTLVATLTNKNTVPLLRFDVIDTGVGMSPDQVGGLFQPFTQADSSITRRHGGTGLGLCISKRLAELLGGGVELIDAAPEKGCHFRATVAAGLLNGVTLTTSYAPRATSNALAGSATLQSAQGALHGCRILVAEDGPDNQRLIGYLLGKAGAETTIVEDGALACDAALAARNGNTPFDAILMDMQMPVMDGYTATRELRLLGYRGLIIAITAHAMADDRGKCLEAGCDDFITKPIDRRELIQTIRRYMVSTVRHAPSECSPTE